MNTGDPALLSIRELTKRYLSPGREEITILQGLNLRLEAGERLALTGSSGSGKSTLTHLIAGTEPLTEGQLEWRGEPLPEPGSAARSSWRLRELGLVFQDFRLFPHLSALENAALPLELLGLRAAEAEQRAHELLKRVGLAERGRHLPSELSGGEQQRVAVARALIHKPALIIADEPTGNLDWRSAQRVADLIFELSAAQGVALFIVTHDLRLAARADRHLSLERGQLRLPTTHGEGVE